MAAQAGIPVAGEKGEHHRGQYRSAGALRKRPCDVCRPDVLPSAERCDGRCCKRRANATRTISATAQCSDGSPRPPWLMAGKMLIDVLDEELLPATSALLPVEADAFCATTCFGSVQIAFTGPVGPLSYRAGRSRWLIPTFGEATPSFTMRGWRRHASLHSRDSGGEPGRRVCHLLQSHFERSWRPARGSCAAALGRRHSANGAANGCG